MANIPIETITKNNDGNTYVIKDANAIPKSGGAVMTGTNLGRYDDTSSFSLWGGSDHSGGAKIDLYGKDHSTYSGCAFIRTIDANNNVYQMALKPDGTLTWGSKSVAMQEDVVPRSGGAVLTGQEFKRTVDDSTLNVYGGNGYSHGAFLQLTGKDETGGGDFNIQAHDGTNSTVLKGKANGALSWSGSSFILSGYDPYIKRNKDDEHLTLCGGSGWEGGGLVGVCGKDRTGENGGNGCVYFIPCTSNKQKSYMFLQGNGTWTWSGTAVQLTSDQRYKQQINAIDDKLLDAWSDVTPVQFKYNDAVDQKGDNARLHTGYVVQQIDEACKSHNIDISAYGLYCHEEYAEETREVENADGTKETKVIRPASEHYSLRYTEALIVECAYLRKCIKELKEEIKELKNKD